MSQTDLFNCGFLSDYTSRRLNQVLQELASLDEDEILSRSTDDLVVDLVDRAHLEPLAIGAEPVDGAVEEGTVEVPDPFGFGGRQTALRRMFNCSAVYEFTGDPELFYYVPQTMTISDVSRADIDTNRKRLTVQAAVDLNGAETAARAALEDELKLIRANAGNASHDAALYNASLESRIRSAVEQCKTLLQKRRSLAGSLGFPLNKRHDAPSPVPITRKRIGTMRTSMLGTRSPYKDEPALTDAQYEDVIGVIKSTLLEMERTPSVVAQKDKDEEEIRDLVLVPLNGTFEGNATGETFVKTGKTDILVRIDDRNVFVGECKWWRGEKAFEKAIDQLLGYLPWRDEKAALLIFIDQKDASAIIEKADKAIRGHPAFKRPGTASNDPKFRRNFVLGHPEDPEREIKVAILFAIFSGVGNVDKDTTKG